jgi:hypothetical protein
VADPCHTKGLEGEIVIVFFFSVRRVTVRWWVRYGPRYRVPFVIRAATEMAAMVNETGHFRCFGTSDPAMHSGRSSIPLFREGAWGSHAALATPRRTGGGYGGASSVCKVRERATLTCLSLGIYITDVQYSAATQRLALPLWIVTTTICKSSAT